MKEILKEWRQFLLTEVQTLKLIDLTTSAKENGYRQNDIQLLTQFWNSNSKIRSKYSKVIEKEISDPNKNEPIAHILSAVKSHYDFVYDKLSSTEKMKLASAEDIDVGKLRVQADLAEQEVEDNIDPMKFRSRGIRDQCKYKDGRPVVGRYADFDVVYSGADWVVIEPKSVKGSIAWSHGKSDGSEETEEEHRVTWCTGTKSDNYYESYAIDYHMFYCIPTNYEEVKVNKPEERRLCLGFINYEGKTYLACDEDLPDWLMKEGVVVDANNDQITKEDVFLLLKNNRLYNNLEKLCSTRKSTPLQEKYRNVSYEEILKKLKSYLNNKDPKEAWFPRNLDETKYIREINISFIEKILNEDSLDKYLISVLTIQHVLVRKDLLETKFGRNLLRKYLKKGENNLQKQAKIKIARRKDLLELEDGKEIIRKLSEDDDYDVKSEVAQREDLLEADPNGDLIRDLAKDKQGHIKHYIASREDLLELEDGKEIIRKLAEDESQGVRCAIARRKDLLELEDWKEIIINLLSDENLYVRWDIVKRDDLDLLEVDPNGDLIRELINDDFLDNDPDILQLKNKLKSKYKSVFNINECLLKNRMANFLF